MRNVKSIWKALGEGQNRDDLREHVQKYFRSISPSSFKMYLDRRPPPDHAKLPRAFAAVFHELNPSKSEREWLEQICGVTKATELSGRAARRQSAEYASKVSDELFQGNASLGDLNFKEVLTYPQWAANPKIFSLPYYRRASILVQGLFSSPSPYFRFGFKLMDARDKLFSPGSIQTEGQNLLIHVGKNLGENDLFMTVYKSGIRVDRNQVLMQYVKHRELPISFELTKEGINRLYVDGKLSYETYFEMDGPVQVAILAWGDENDFECHYKEAAIIANRPSIP